MQSCGKAKEFVAGTLRRLTDGTAWTSIAMFESEIWDVSCELSLGDSEYRIFISKRQDTRHGPSARDRLEIGYA